MLNVYYGQCKKVTYVTILNNICASLVRHTLDWLVPSKKHAKRCYMFCYSDDSDAVS